MSYRFDKFKNYYHYLTDKHVLGTYPIQIGIELTNKCNLSCVMCSHQEMKRRQGFMSEDLFVRIIDEIKGKTEFVYLHGMGESLLHPDFFKLSDYAARNGLTTLFSTNITLLSQENSRKLLVSGIDFIILALDGISKETYEKIRIGGKFQESLQKVKNFLKLKNKLRTKKHVEIQIILMEKNREEINRVKELFTDEELSAINSFRVKPIFIFPSMNTEEIAHHHPCYFLWSYMMITWEGMVPLCCMDYDSQVVLGDINKSSIYDIWNNQRIVELRELHKKLCYDQLGICNDCSTPEKNYFSHLTILANVLFSSKAMRKYLPIFEKHAIIKKLIGRK